MNLSIALSIANVICWLCMVLMTEVERRRARRRAADISAAIDRLVSLREALERMRKEAR